MHFRGDDVAVGGRAAIVAYGTRRVLLQNLSPQQSRWLGALRTNHTVERRSEWAALYDNLLKREFISPLPAPKRRWSLRVPSRVVQQIARPLMPFTRPWPLALLAVLSGVILLSGIKPLFQVRSLPEWFSTVSPRDFVLTSLIFAGCVLVHELGHAATCMRLTGLAGGIRLTGFRGIPAVAADVSTVCLATSKGKAMIAMAGAIFQIAFSTILLMSHHPDIQIAASISILAAIFNAVPLPKSDGYWFLRDLFGIRLRPRLTYVDSRDHWSDFVYGYVLILMTALFCWVLAHQSHKFWMQAVEIEQISMVRSIMLLAISIYTVVVVGLFIRANCRLLFDPMHQID